MKRTDKHKKIELQQELIQRCKRNDQRAQIAIYNQYVKAMLNTSYRIVGNAATAEDIVQEAFLAAFRRIKTFKAEVTFGAWIKRIVINHSIDYLRKRHPDIELTETYKGLEEQKEEDNENSGLEYSPNDIRKAIQRLPKGYQLVLTLYLFEGYDHEEIGQILKITPSTSRSQYTRAKQKLKNELKKHSNGRI